MVTPISFIRNLQMIGCHGLLDLNSLIPMYMFSPIIICFDFIFVLCIGE